MSLAGASLIGSTRKADINNTMQYLVSVLGGLNMLAFATAATLEEVGRWRNGEAEPSSESEDRIRLLCGITRANARLNRQPLRAFLCAQQPGLDGSSVLEIIRDLSPPEADHLVTQWHCNGRK